MTKKNTQYVWLVVSLGILLTMVHCYHKCHHFEKASPIQSSLISPFKSYISIEEARQMLPPHLRNWQVFEDYPFSMIEKYPPFYLYSVTIEDYKHLNYTGQLGLTFYNNRLVETSFSSANMKSYIEALEKIEDLKITSSYNFSFDKINIKPYTYVRLISSSPQDDIYHQVTNTGHQDIVTWEDIRLLREKER